VIVGLGASAGGLGALKTFFGNVPESTGLTFVVVMHLSTDHESHLAELLQPFINIPVTQVGETLAMEPDHVYVIPPGCNLSAVDSHLRLSDLESQRKQRAPIDHFFRTLAKTHDGNAIAVILSGTGSDGALGLKAVRESGGLALVQDPTEAEYDGMPRSAIATGLVDRALPVAQMPATIINYVGTRPKLAVPETGPTKSDVERHLAQILARLRARTGRDFSRYKTSTVVRRIQRRMQLNQVETLSAYEDLLATTPAEALSLADDMLITVTNFFRDTKVFDFLEQEVIRKLFEGKTHDDEVRAWAAGCATGEEAYSVAILLLEQAARMKSPPRIQLFASDLHEESLAKAREGFYSGEVAIDVGPERLARFFVKHEGGYQVRQELRDAIVFTPHNLLTDPPFSKLDLISCRNLLIYLRRDVQPRVLELFHYALRTDGILLLGTSETGDESNLFRTVSKSHCIYQKRNVPQSELQLPVFPLAPTYGARAHGAQAEEGQGPDLHTYGQIHLTLLEQYAPPSLVVNAGDKVVHLSPNVGRFLVHTGGEPTTGVFKLVRPEFRAALGEALHAAREGRATHSEPIPMKDHGETKLVSLRVRPATGDRGQDGFVLVVFDEDAEPADEQLIEQELDHTDPRAVELARTQQRLQSLIEDHEASKEEMQAANEELQSSNEELRSTMEELETSKEELQSMNEELRTVNQENRNKVEELATLSADLQSLMAATQIPTLFLDRELRVVRYTPQLSEIFHIRMSDRGRPVTELKARIAYDELQDDARRVLDRLAPIEREIRHGTEARWFLTRVLPYHGIENRLDGVVITFVDITLRKDAENFVHQTAQRFRGLVEASAQMVWTTDARGNVTEDSPTWREFTGQNYDQFKGWGWLHAVHPDDRGTARSAWEEAMRTGGTLVSEFRVYHHASDNYRWTAVRAVPLRQANGGIDGWVGMNIDISELRAADDALRDADKRKDEFLAILGHELRNPLAPLATGIQLLRNAGDKPEIVETVQTMMGRQLHHLVRLVDDLLDLSRITRGRVDLKREPLDLRTVIERAIEVSRPILTDNRHKLTLKLPKVSMPVEGDFDRLTQVIGNLVNNAGKYTAPGGKIEVDARVEDGRAIVRVRDNGFGIPPDRVNKLFRMFSQVPEHRARAGGGGLGIGLALSRHLVELHGGMIGVTSDGLGEGSEFTIRLPLTKRALPTESEEPDWDSTDMPLRRVLVVDDNVDAATSLSMMLLAKGHTVQTVHDASAALQTVERFAPEIVLLDIELPGMSGYEVAQRIRSMDGGTKIMLVAITGRGQKEDKERAMEAGFDEHLTKPVDTSLLASVIINGSSARVGSV
jgi:two-component system, chemotaxis family, CheB/CheR fusion protein